MEGKASSDVVDILGFLAYEIVCKLTETAIAVKNEWNTRLNTKETRDHSTNEREDGALEVGHSLFEKPVMDQKPLEPRHIHEAFRRLQRLSFPMTNFSGAFIRNKLAFI